VKFFVNTEWVRAEPTSLSLIPFDDSTYTTASGSLFVERDFQLELGPLGGVDIKASNIQIHLFVITLFVALISPFGGFFVSGLKRSLRAR
jgi:hypothetical protein